MREIFQNHFSSVAAALSITVLCASSEASAQTGVPPANPSVPAQTYDARQLELQRVREAAQRARASAQQAAMARSADRATEEQHIQGNVERSLEVKQLKAQAAADARSQTAANAYQGVSPGEINTWRGADGESVKVQREVPQQFTDTIPVEAQAEETSSGIGGAVKGVLSWRPSIPFLGKKKKDDRGIPALPTFTPAEQLGLDTPAPPLQAAVAATRKPEKKKKQGGDGDGGGFRIPLIGGLFQGGDGEEATKVAATRAPAEPDAPYFGGPATASPPAASIADSGESQPGLFSRLNPFSGKAENPELVNPYDSSDAPMYTDSGATPSAELPSAGEEASAGLFGPGSGSDSVGGSGFASSGGGGDGDGDGDDDKPGFFGRLFGGGDKSGSADSRGVDSATVGGIYVVEQEGAQLIKFGNSTISSDSRPMPVGTVVRVTKDGEEWSSVQLASGAEGIMRKKTLRPAGAGEGSMAMFAHLDKPNYPTTARIESTRSATGSSASARQAPVYAPTPDLPSSADGAGDVSTTGINSLLPPLPTSAVE